MASVFEIQGRDRLLDGLLCWLAENLSSFDPPQEEEVLDAAPEEILPCRRRKAFGELGAALRLAAGVPELWNRSSVLRLAEAWQEMARRRNIFFDARRRVHLFPGSCVALAVLRAFGAVPAEAAESLQRVLDRGFMDRIERSAWQKLDLKYYCDAAGLRHGIPVDETLLRQCSLIDPPALPHVQSMDLYGVTHLIFHFTDFGRRDVRPMLGLGFQDLCDYVELALAMNVAERDWDLTGEMLLSRLCLGSWSGPLGREAAKALCEAQQPAGFIPDRRWLAGLAETDQPGQRTEEEFFAVYHPTLVTLFLICGDILSNGTGPSSR